MTWKSGELGAKGVLQDLGAVDATFFRQSGHPGREGDVLADGTLVGLGTVGDGVHADQGADVSGLRGEIGLPGGSRGAVPGERDVGDGSDALVTRD